MSWLLQRGIAVTPRASSVDNILPNSPFNVGHYPRLSVIQDLEIENAVKSILLGADLSENYGKHVDNLNQSPGTTIYIFKII